MVVPTRAASPPGTARGTLRLALLLLLAVPLLATVRSAGAQEVPELGINSKAYIVVDAETGEVFAQRNADQRRAMASLTKVFTAIEAIEAAPPDRELTTGAADLRPAAASVMGLSPGETYTVRDLLHGLMLPSGNDAAYALARGLGYGPSAKPGREADDEAAVERFVAGMNQRIRDMGLENTQLKNPDGWGVPGHYSTPADLATFVMYALQYPRFVELISAVDYSMSTTGQYVTNNNRLLNTYPDLIGGKTGYDDDAGWCLIEVAERDGSTMISVTLDGIAPDDWYDDNRVLLDYAFEQKAARGRGEGIPAGARVLSYLDPDAAVIARGAKVGASLGAAGVPEPPLGAQPAGAAPQPGDEAGATSSATGDTASEGGGLTAQALAAAGVAGLILFTQGVGAFRQPRIRAARPASVPAEPVAQPGTPGTGETDRPRRLRLPLRRAV